MFYSITQIMLLITLIGHLKSLLILVQIGRLKGSNSTLRPSLEKMCDDLPRRLEVTMRSWIKAGGVPLGSLTWGLVHISRSVVPSRGDNLNQRGYIIAWRHVITFCSTTSSFQNPLIYSSHLVCCFSCSFALFVRLSSTTLRARIGPTLTVTFCNLAAYFTFLNRKDSPL